MPKENFKKKPGLPFWQKLAVGTCFDKRNQKIKTHQLCKKVQ